MKPREIEVQIEELILHGFDPGARWAIGDALQSELRGLLARKGVPEGWLSNPDYLNAGTISAPCLTNPVATVAQVAGAIHGAGTPAQ